MQHHFVGHVMPVFDDQNEVQHDFFCYLTLFAPASTSCDTNGIVNNIVVFVRSRQLKQGAIYPFWSFDTTDATVNVK